MRTYLRYVKTERCIPWLKFIVNTAVCAHRATLLNNIIIILLQIIARWGCDDPGTLWWKRCRHSTINIILIVYNIVPLLPIRRYAQRHAGLILCRFLTFERFDYLSEARYNMTLLFENSSRTHQSVSWYFMDASNLISRVHMCCDHVYSWYLHHKIKN